MKLLSLSYNNPENSLKTYEFDFHNGRNDLTKLDPLCFVGLNGSGKSKLIEIIAEIFFVLDANGQSHSTKKQKRCHSNFKVYYRSCLKGENKIIKVTGKKNHLPLVHILNMNTRSIHENDVKNHDDKENMKIPNDQLASVLPQNIIGYSSGHNETISNQFLTLRKNDLITALRHFQKGVNFDVNLTRTLFLDRDSTKLLLITAYIYDEYQDLQNKFSKYLNLEKLNSFQIKFDTKDDDILLSRRMEATLQKLTKASFMSSINDRSFILDFYIDTESKKVIKHFFDNPKEFFNDLYELSSLNLINKSKYEEQIFEIPESELKIKLNRPSARTTYQNLSDGEHQFIQIFTASVLFASNDTLFLFDEPESHFNPVWRAKFFNTLDQLLSKRQKGAEILVSTHSPYLVSGCKKENVIKFVRSPNGISFERLADETFGASFDSLLKVLFDMRGMVSELAKNEMQTIVNSERDRDKKIKLIIESFGDSYEKRLLLNMLNKGVLDAVPSKED